MRSQQNRIELVTRPDSWGGVGEGGVDSGVETFPSLGQYDDFHTIDWQRDIARDRMRHRWIKRKRDSLLDMIRGAHDAWSGWLCVLIVGILSGLMAGIIDIGSAWLSGTKSFHFLPVK